MVWPWRREPRGERHQVETVDRLVVQQYDPLRPSTIGGIDTCLRGVLEYAPPDVSLAVVGVDESGARDIPLGRWQTVRRGRARHRLPAGRAHRPHPAQGLGPVLRAAHRRAAALPVADPAGGVGAGASGGCRAGDAVVVPWSVGVLHPYAAGWVARADVGFVLAVHGESARAVGSGDRSSGGAGDRVQSGVCRGGAAVESADGGGADVVRSGDHRWSGAGCGVARCDLGRPVGGAEGPDAGRAGLRRAGPRRAGRAVDARPRRVGQPAVRRRGGGRRAAAGRRAPDHPARPARPRRALPRAAAAGCS